MTPEELQERVLQLQAELDEQAEGAIDPQIVQKVKNFIGLSVQDIMIAFEVVGVEPTEEQKIEIEQRLIESKAAAMSQKQERNTIAKWNK